MAVASCGWHASVACARACVVGVTTSAVPQCARSYRRYPCATWLRWAQMLLACKPSEGLVTGARLSLRRYFSTPWLRGYFRGALCRPSSTIVQTSASLASSECARGDQHCSAAAGGCIRKADAIAVGVQWPHGRRAGEPGRGVGHPGLSAHRSRGGRGPRASGTLAARKEGRPSRGGPRDTSVSKEPANARPRWSSISAAVFSSASGSRSAATAAAAMLVRI